MKKIFMILSLILLLSLPISILLCYISNICKGGMNFLGAFLYLIGYIGTILGYFLYNLFYYIGKKDTSFESNFYKKTWLIVSIYLFLLISFLFLPGIYEYINRYGKEIIIIVFPYLLLYLLIIPVILISGKKINTKKILFYLSIIFFIIIGCFYLSNNYKEKKENQYQEKFDNITIGNCKNINFDNFNNSIQATLKSTCSYNKIINENGCEKGDGMCKEYFCNGNKSIKAVCSIDNKCICK